MIRAILWLELFLVFLSIFVVLYAKRRFTIWEKEISLKKDHLFKIPRNRWLLSTLASILWSIVLFLPFTIKERGFDLFIWAVLCFVPFWVLLFLYWSHRKAYINIDHKRFTLDYGFYKGEFKKISFQCSEIEEVNFKPNQKRPKKIFIKKSDGTELYLDVNFLSSFKGHKQVLAFLRNLTKENFE